MSLDYVSSCASKSCTVAGNSSNSGGRADWSVSATTSSIGRWAMATTRHSRFAACTGKRMVTNSVATVIASATPSRAGHQQRCCHCIITRRKGRSTAGMGVRCSQHCRCDALRRRSACRKVGDREKGNDTHGVDQPSGKGPGPVSLTGRPLAPSRKVAIGVAKSPGLAKALWLPLLKL